MSQDPGVDAGGHHLPAPVSSFVGRSAQREALLRVLHDNRLVTLVGAPGVGKTRLALEVTRDALAFCDSAWWVDLGPIEDADGVVRALARALGVQEHPGLPVPEAIAAKLGGRQALIVLDNCEHLIEACTTTVQALLETCDGVRVLATSREPLRVLGEHRCEVASLSVPDINDSPEAVAATEAGRLFCQRATAVQAQFVLDAATAPAVAEICRRLDGIPLAIELAAARVAVLSPNEIVNHVADRLALLKNDQPTIPARHQTLVAALERSYDSLSRPEQALLRRLGVFQGGATLEAVRAVCTGPDTGPADALDLLTGLAMKSLVVVEAGGTEPERYRLLHTVRAVAINRLAAAGEWFELATRHAGWFTAFAEQAKAHLTGSRPDEWGFRLGADSDNLSAALNWTLRYSDGDEALRLASSMTLYCRLRGYYSQGLRNLEAALIHCPDAPDAVRAEGLWGTGLLAVMADDARAGDFLEESLRLYQGLNDIAGQGRATLLLGNHLLFEPDPSPAKQLLEESVTLAREANDAWCLANALALSAQVQLNQGHTGIGRRLLEEALAVAREAHEPQGASVALILLGRLAALEGDYPLAERLLDEALSITRRLHEPSGTWAAQLTLARVAAGRGDYSRAEELLEASVGLERQIGDPPYLTTPLLLGRMLLDTGDLEKAEHLFLVVLQGLGLTGNRHAVAYPGLAGLALVASLESDATRARALWEDALALTVPGGERFRPGTLLYEFHTGSVLYDLGNVARTLGESEEAKRLHTDSIKLSESVGDLPGMVRSAEALGGLHAEAGRSAVAVCIFAAAQAVRDSHGFARAPVMQARYAADLEAARSSLEAGEFEASWTEGAELSPSEAVRSAIRMSGSGSQSGNGWETLTPTELDVVRLVAAGFSNPEVAERLFVSRGTVQNHLYHVFAKLGISSRVDLALEAARRGLEP